MKTRERWIKRRIEQNQLRTLEATTQIRPADPDDIADIEARLHRLHAERLQLEAELQAATENRRPPERFIDAAPASEAPPATPS